MQVTHNMFSKVAAFQAQNTQRNAILGALQQLGLSKTKWMVGLDVPIKGVQSISTHSRSVIGVRQSSQAKKLGSYASQTTSHIQVRAQDVWMMCIWVDFCGARGFWLRCSIITSPFVLYTSFALKGFMFYKNVVH